MTYNRTEGVGSENLKNQSAQYWMYISSEECRIN